MTFLSVIYEGKPVKTPDAGAMWRMISEHSIENVFAAPTAWRAIRREDPELQLMKKYDITPLKNLFLAGERLDPPTFDWLRKMLPGRGILDNWWQTETGWQICANPIGLQPNMPVKAGSATVPLPGWKVEILGEHGEQLPPGETGQVAIKLPLPPSALFTVWNNHSRFISGYLSTYPGYYLTGDGGYVDDDGYLFIMGRTDDVINVSAHRLSTGEMEEVVGSHPAVAECAVFAVSDSLKGEVPVGFVVLKDTFSTASSAELKNIYGELVHSVREQIGAIASFRHVYAVKRLPKTRSGKILRATLRKMTAQENVPVPSTIDDPVILDEIREVMKCMQLGFAKRSCLKNKIRRVLRLVYFFLNFCSQQDRSFVQLPSSALKHPAQSPADLLFLPPSLIRLS
jgi:propionyl-CoA synthetase